MKRQFINPKTLVSDTVAGLTLGIESIPDAMASALLATVNPIHGVYAVMLSTPVGALFASSVFMSVQTTSAMSLIVASVPQIRNAETGVGALLALAIITGIFMVIAGLLKFGSLLRFVPNSVMTGFINGIALLIILGQLSNFTGYETQGPNKIAQTIDLFRHLSGVDIRTLLIGILTILLIITLEKTRLKSFGIVVALIVASLLVPALGWNRVATVADIAEIPNSLPRPMLPPLAVFPAMILPALSLALVGLIQGAGVSQNYVNPDGRYPDASGDFTGQGVANIAAGIFQGMPVGGSLSATALVTSGGARSRFGNIFAGITIAISLLLFSQGLSAIAMPALAGLLIVVGFGTFKFQDITMVWQTGRIQQVVMVTTFAFTLLIPLQYAVLMGVALAVLLYVVDQSNSVTVKEWNFQKGQEVIEQDPPEVLEPNNVTILVPFGSLFYAAATIFEKQLPTLDDRTRNSVVIITLHARTDLGSTFLETLERFARELSDHQSKLILAEITPETKDVLEKTGQISTFGRDNIFEATEVVYASLKDAHHEAEKWVAQNMAQEEV